MMTYVEQNIYNGEGKESKTNIIKPIPSGIKKVRKPTCAYMCWYNEKGWKKIMDQNHGLVEVAKNGQEVWRSMKKDKKQKWLTMMEETNREEYPIPSHLEQDCQSSVVRCPFRDCMDKVPMASMSQHVTSFPHLIITKTSSNLHFFRYISFDNKEIPLQWNSADPIRFIFSGCIFYLQTIVSPDNNFIYNFVQMEGTVYDCAKFWVSIKASSRVPGIARSICQRLRPVSLDMHCRDDLQSVGDSLIMTKGMAAGLLQYESEQDRYYLKMEVKMINNNETGEQDG